MNEIKVFLRNKGSVRTAVIYGIVSTFTVHALGTVQGLIIWTITNFKIVLFCYEEQSSDEILLIASDFCLNRRIDISYFLMSALRTVSEQIISTVLVPYRTDSDSFEIGSFLPTQNKSRNRSGTT